VQIFYTTTNEGREVKLRIAILTHSSNLNEYLATYVDGILIWSKDPVAVIKSLEKIYILKSVGIPEYYLG
jgi:hypothetical protein